ncbi:glycosyltransferase, partial [Salinimicrobium oceani]
VDNPLAYIKAADVLVLPSIIEGLPGVLLEAMYCKTPVVAYDVGGISEIVLPHTGRLIPKGNEHAFATAILDTFNSPDSSKIENAYKLVLRDYLNAKIAKEFLHAYNSLIASKN